jgi:glycosyltransferase involved in cell wall biosynthesis
MNWFRTPRIPQSVVPFHGKIEVFSRHCIFSSISQHKKRFPSFSRKACYLNLLETLNSNQANLTFFLDDPTPPRDHFLREEKIHPVIEIQEGSEAGSFLRLLDYILSLNLHPETIVYLVEDDYIHKPGWIDILLEGFSVPGAEYVTLYDHRDKYDAYPRLQSKIFVSSSCHWRSIPSTTHTFATRFKTLLRDLPIHQKFSVNRKISLDHDKFVYLQKKRKTMLISCLPGWSTHAEPEFASPCMNWESYLNK